MWQSKSSGTVWKTHPALKDSKDRVTIPGIHAAKPVMYARQCKGNMGMLA
jgi:hypothetical protein